MYCLYTQQIAGVVCLLLRLSFGARRVGEREAFRHADTRSTPDCARRLIAEERSLVMSANEE